MHKYIKKCYIDNCQIQYLVSSIQYPVFHYPVSVSLGRQYPVFQYSIVQYQYSVLAIYGSLPPAFPRPCHSSDRKATGNRGIHSRREPHPSSCSLPSLRVFSSEHVREHFARFFIQALNTPPIYTRNVSNIRRA